MPIIILKHDYPKSQPVGQLSWNQASAKHYSTEENKIILSPARPKYNLDELLQNVTPDMQHDEIDWGEPAGEESWF